MSLRQSGYHVRRSVSHPLGGDVNYGSVFRLQTLTGIDMSQTVGLHQLPVRTTRHDAATYAWPFESATGDGYYAAPSCTDIAYLRRLTQLHLEPCKEVETGYRGRKLASAIICLTDLG